MSTKILAKKKPLQYEEAFDSLWRRPTFPLGIAVSLALAGLTSLFGMGRGGPCRNNHPKVFTNFSSLCIFL